jgi:hypothetical protein
MARQFVVQLENHPGALAHLTRALAARFIDIRHIWCFGAGAVACAFIVPDNEHAMREVLQTMGCEFIEGEPLVVDVEDRPGGLADVIERFAAAGVNILGTMCVGQRPGIIEMAFTVDDEPTARKALAAAQPEVVGAAG